MSLKELVLPKELKTIGWEAFENCYSLEHIQFPEYLQTVKGFNGCVSLTKLVLPKCKNIAQKAFCACRKLNEVVLPEGLEYIGRNAFYKTALRQITLPESLNEMKNPFSAPVEVEILSPNFKVVDDVIYSADGTELVAILEEETSFVVPENVKTIGDGALANLEALETVYLPEGLEKVKNCDEFNWVTTICIPPKTKDKFIPLVDQWAGVTNNKKKLKVVR